MEGERNVRVEVLGDVCIGSANCSAVLPEVFDHLESGIAYVRSGHEVTEESEKLLEAVELCPVAAIVLSTLE